MSSNEGHFTRGKGLLEPLLARLRAERANTLIPADLREGRILDIGCGSYPYFLAHTAFKEKFGIDQLTSAQTTAAPLEIQVFHLDLNNEPKLPFEDNFFNVITLLAVVEHLNPASMQKLFVEIYRVLQPGGVVIMTTPAAWSDGLLRLMARIKLVSEEEINEHKFAYTLPLLGWYFGRGGFDMNNLKFGYFEMFLNLWAVAKK